MNDRKATLGALITSVPLLLNYPLDAVAATTVSLPSVESPDSPARQSLQVAQTQVAQTIEPPGAPAAIQTGDVHFRC